VVEAAATERAGVGLERAHPDEGVLHDPHVRCTVHRDGAEREHPVPIVHDGDLARLPERVAVHVRGFVEDEPIRAVDRDEVRGGVVAAAEEVGEVRWHGASVPMRG